MSLAVDEKELVSQAKQQGLLTDVVEKMYSHKVFGIPVDVILISIPIIIFMGLKRK